MLKPSQLYKDELEKENIKEMRVHPQSIYNAIYQYKKKYGDSEP